MTVSMSDREEARQARVDAWLSAGGIVVTSTERVSRTVTAEFAAARRAEGLRAWATPATQHWDAWVREEFHARDEAGFLVLNPAQEQALWVRAIRSLGAEELLGLERLAQLAGQAYRLICRFAPAALERERRLDWPESTTSMSGWMAAFDGLCADLSVVSGNRVGLELTGILEADRRARPGLLLIGFDRLLETQIQLLEAWGDWELEEEGTEGAADFLEFASRGDELAAVVEWQRKKLTEDSGARLLVVTSAQERVRGELERAFLAASDELGDGLEYEFSLGLPLAKMGLVRAAVLVLRWLGEPLAEAELDWLLGSGFLAGSQEERIALPGAMPALRRRGLERPEWELADFCAFVTVALGVQPEWTKRLTAAQSRMASLPKRRAPMDWAEEAARLLEEFGWPGDRPLGSVAFQARKRWDRVLEECASLGFDGRRQTFSEFAGAVTAGAEGTIFAPESQEAQVLVIGPQESAGLLADGVWFLGADEQSWPGRGQPNPLIPLNLQREAGMPFANLAKDWALAESATRRLTASTEGTVFSYARQADTTEVRPSRLVLGIAGAARKVAWDGGKARFPLTEKFEDRSRVPFLLPRWTGGAGTLTDQSLCPFKAFAGSRLGVERFAAAELGLNAQQRGELLHAVMRRVWGGEEQGGIRSSE